MDDKVMRSALEEEISFQRVLNAILHKIWIVILTAALCTTLTAAVTVHVVNPKYQSSAMFYVNNSVLSVGDVSISSITSSDITAAKNLVNSYVVILRTRESLNEVIDYAGVDRSYSELKKMISASSVEDTEIFKITVTSTDPVEAEKIAGAIAYVLPKRISGIIEGTSAKVVDAAVVASHPSSPNYVQCIVLGFLLGCVLSVGLIVANEVFDITIRNAEDLEQEGKYTVLATVPDMNAPTKGGYYYTYDNGKQAGQKKTKSAKGTQPVLVGTNISFAASEAYKLLRTKLQFSFADEQESRVIAVSSAMSGEGKSLTSVNLAYSLSELNKKVLLIDCDMRRPSIAAKLPVKKEPGLSDYLTGHCDASTIMQYCGIDEAQDAFAVISAGRNPPNPMELLSSERMEWMLTKLRKVYDYIILDLPPVGEVADALTVARMTDGVLLVVRQDYGNRVAFADTVRQFGFVGARILGVVYNCASDSSGAYGKKYYKKYYNTAAKNAEQSPKKTNQ